MARYNPLFLLAILCSGAAGLMYETLWVRLLGFTFGTTALATSLVLSAFFAGLGLGGWLMGRFIDRVERPVRVYAAAELLILLGSLAVYVGLHAITPLYVWLYQTIFQQSTALVTIAKFLLSFLLILVPSAMMGATLPIIARCYIGSQRGFGRALGLLYAVNTIGGAAGLILMGFFLVELVGIRASYLLSGAFNLAAILFALASSRWLPVADEPPVETTTPPISPSPHLPISPSLSPAAVYLLTFSFGFISIGLEVLWIRLWSYISLHSNAIKLGFAPAEFSSTYVFSGIVFVFLVGIALGGVLVKRLPDDRRRALAALGIVQLVQGAYVVAATQAERLLYLDALWVKLLEVAVIVLPATVMMGMTFPLLAHVHVRRRDDMGADFGAYYASNAAGCALGSLFASLVLLPTVGTYRGLLVFGFASVAIGLVLLLAAREAVGRRRTRLAYAGSLVGVLLAGSLVAGTASASPIANQDVLFEEDNEVAHTLVTGRGQNRLLIMNNNAQAGSSNYETGFGARTLQVPAALMDRVPKDILLICVGVGNAWSAAQRWDASITAVDINPAVFRAMPVMHPERIAQSLTTPKNRPIVADGRNYLLLDQRQYDLINVDPGPPITQPGMVNLHTREFYELAKSRLKPGGVLYMRLSRDVDNEVFYRMLVRSIADVFPEVTLWTFEGGVDVIAADWRFSQVVRRSELIDARVFGEMDDWFLMGREEVDRYVAGYPAVTDDDPKLEYYLLSRVRGAWPDGTPYEVDEKRNRRFLLEHRAPMKKYLREVIADGRP